MQGVNALPENTSTATCGCSAAAADILVNQSQVAVPPKVLFETV